MMDSILIAIIGGIFGGILTYAVQFFFEKRKSNYLAELQQREKRYKSVIIFMECYLHPKNIKVIQLTNPGIKSQSDLKEALKFEYREMLLFVSDDVIKSLKQFIEEPSEEKYFQTIKLIRKDLWKKNTKLGISDISI